jgi:CBS domain-containing protein
MRLISEVMTPDVRSVSPRDTVRRAAQIMDDLNVGVLPVCDDGRLVGMVTDRDITVRATSAGMVPDDAIVEQVMSTDVRYCFEDQPLDDIMRQMADTQIRRVPVISRDDPHRLVGIVSLGDIATKAAGAQDQDIQQVVEKVSFPSEPDRSAQGATAAVAGAASGRSNTGTATGLAGSDVLADRMNPGIEVSATADPSNVVEVTPADLVNRNAPGSTTLHSSTTGMGASGASGGAAGTKGSSGAGAGAKPQG